MGRYIRSHLAGLNRIFKVTVQVEVVEGRGRVKEGVVLRDAVLRRGGQ